MKSTDVKNLKLSEKIKLYHTYEYHPLRTQYYEEKNSLKTKLKSKYKKQHYRYLLKKIIPVLMAIFYFIAFAYAFEIDIEAVFVIIIILGLLNLGVCYISFFSSESDNPIENSKEYISFKKKYENLGLIEITEWDVFSGNCIEKNLDGEHVCGATQRPLTFEQQCKCSKIIDKKKCSTCVEAVYGKDMLSNWPDEFVQ